MSVPRPLRLHRWFKVTPNRWNQRGTLAFQTGCLPQPTEAYMSRTPKRRTSAERSAAREDDAQLRGTSRVASPLVMATRGSCVAFNHVRLALRASSELKPLPPASQGGSATRYDTRLPRRLLWLRCAPPSFKHPVVAVAAAAALFGVANAKASESGHLKRSFGSPPVASAQECSGRRCGGSLWRSQRESERKRAPEAKLQQPASRERSRM
jgi:hypothetical protein